MKLVIFLFGCLAIASASRFQSISSSKLPFNLGGRITNGEKAARDQFKYQVGLRLYGDEGAFWCGGTVLSERWILTAAHCTYEMNGVDVYLGAWNRNDKLEEGQQIVYAGKRYIVNHEEYDDENIKNDIALIKLPAPIKFNQFIQPAKLPKLDKKGNYKTYEGEIATASGWGVTEEGSSPDILRYIEKPISKLSSCNRWYLGGLNAEQQICQQATNKQNTCSGDSGGPLVVEEDGEHVVIGATSFGIALGCQSGWPGVFTRVTGYLDWIQKHTEIPV